MILKTFCESSRMSRLFVVESVSKSESPELISDDALEGRTQERSSHRFLENSADEKVDLVKRSVELLKSSYQLFLEKFIKIYFMDDSILRLTTVKNPVRVSGFNNNIQCWS